MGFGKNKAIIHVLVIALLILPAIPVAALALPAFPGAQGWGSDTVGGRGGTLCKVNTTADTSTGSCVGSGATKICTGTFRFCTQNNSTITGPRYVIFTTGGLITLSSTKLYISIPYQTIAGQTAPGGGIAFKSGNLSIEGTHDIILRGTRTRVDSIAGADGSQGFGMAGCSSQAYNIIVDHNSFAWHNDEGIVTLQTCGSFGGPRDVTFSWNIIGESLTQLAPAGDDGGGPQWYTGHGPLIGFGEDWSTRKAHRLSFHHNYVVHNRIRNPAVCAYTELEWVNNYIYNYGPFGEGMDIAGKLVAINNYWQKGPLVPSSDSEARIYPGYCSGVGIPIPNSSIYVSGNRGPHRPNDSYDERTFITNYSSYTSLFTAGPPFTRSNVTIDSVDTIKDKILGTNGAGATVPDRDAIDQRITADAYNNTSPWTNINDLNYGYLNSPSQVGGWPTYSSGTYPTDTDGDGMPDAWETAHGTNPNVVDYNGDVDRDGYTNIEEYINSFFPAGPPSSSALIPNPPSIIGVN